MSVCPADIEQPLSYGVAADDVFVLNNNPQQVRALVEVERFGPVRILSSFIVRLGLVGFVSDSHNAVRVLQIGRGLTILLNVSVSLLSLASRGDTVNGIACVCFEYNNIEMRNVQIDLTVRILGSMLCCLHFSLGRRFQRKLSQR